MGEPRRQMKLAGCLVGRAPLPCFIAFWVCMGCKCQDHRQEASPCEQTIIEKQNQLFPFCRFKRQIPRNCQLVLILGSLSWSRCEMRPGAFSFLHSQPVRGHPELPYHLERAQHWAQMEQQKGAENQQSQEWSLLFPPGVSLAKTSGFCWDSS